MALPERMKFGIFLGPFHRVGENPTLAMDRDMELVQWLDYLGYDEAWIGEHHSAGWETISSPEIFMAVAADRTKHIKLGTGVISLPYHHPFMVANRMVQLDHMTHGRVMLGVGPGALPGDAYMLGIDASTQRERMDEAVEAAVENALGAGMVSAGGNRKALRVHQEPLDVYREYLATYCQEQAFCHLSDQLIGNLERNWNAKEKRLR